MPEYTGPIPVPSPETRPFWDAARRHELSLPKCRACGALHYYPRGACPTCLSGDLSWERVSGKGSLHTFTIVHRGQKGFPVPTPYVLAVVGRRCDARCDQRRPEHDGECQSSHALDPPSLKLL